MHQPLTAVPIAKLISTGYECNCGELPYRQTSLSNLICDTTTYLPCWGEYNYTVQLRNLASRFIQAEVLTSLQFEPVFVCKIGVADKNPLKTLKTGLS